MTPTDVPTGPPAHDPHIPYAGDVATYALRLGDDALVLCQRTGEWVAQAPQLEEDVALGNIALDLLGQARALLTYAGSLQDPVRTEDQLAYHRDERDWLNVQLVELSDRRDFGHCMARLLVFASWQRELWEALQGSVDDTLAAVAGKAVKEVDYHRDHATQWIVRLGDGTDESHARVQRALDSVWSHVDELFEHDALVDRLVAARVAVDPGALREPVLTHLRTVLGEAGLAEPASSVQHSGGRRGVHTEQMGYLLAEMQHLARSHPEARW